MRLDVKRYNPVIKDHVVRLNRRPLDIPDNYVIVRACTIKGKTVLLCPVDKLHLIPKGLSVSTQAEFSWCEQPGDGLFLIAPTGKIYSLPTV